MESLVKDDLIKLLSVDSSRAIADMVKEKVGNNPVSFDKLLDISLTTKPPICWRAARVIDLCSQIHNELFIPYVELIVNKLIKFDNSSMKRIYLHVLLSYTAFIKSEQVAQLINVCFNWLNSEQEAIAVRVYSMYLLSKIAEKEPDIQNELLLILEDKMPYFTSGGLISATRKTIRKIQKMQLKI